MLNRVVQKIQFGLNYGTLDYLRENNEQYFVLDVKEYEVELMIKRIIPSHNTYPLRIRIHPENTRLLRMVMREYPLDIRTDQWNTALGQIKEQEELAESVSKLDYVEPDKIHFKGNLMPFQKQALDFIIKTKGKTLITDEMGLGKTWESLAFVSTQPNAMPVIIVAPLVTLVNWKREIQKLIALSDKRKGQSLITDGKTREPRVFLIRHGNVKGKKNKLPVADFYLINYELVSKRFKDLCSLNPKFLIYDEVHSLRRDETEKYKACYSLANQKSVLYRIGLSGTPIYNRGIEMYNICEIIKQGLLGERNEFIRRYCSYYFEPEKTSEEGKKGLANFLKKSIMIRRKKMDVLTDLPDKIRLKQEIDIDTDLYKSEIEKLYKKINIARNQLSKSSTELEQKEGLFELNKTIREMRIAERQIAGLAKVKHVVDYLEDLLENYDEEKFVVFCHHLNVHKAIFDGLWKYNPVQVIGGQSDKQRQEAIDKFQNPENKRDSSRVIICGLRAGSLGINLTSSAYVIFAELDWSPSVHRQAEDRLHRIGQKHKVFAHYLEGIGTFDEVLSDVLLRKTVDISDVLGDKMESMNNKKAVEFLESKYKFQKTSKIAELITNPVVPDRTQSYVRDRLERFDDL